MRMMSYRRMLAISLSVVLSVVAMTPAVAQSWVKKASKSVFTLKTFAADGTLRASGYGFFVGANGEAVSSFEPFRGASAATVIDAAGKEYPVEAMLGANETYDVAKFRVNAKKTQPLTLAAVKGTEGAAVWLLPYLEQKTAVEGVLRKAETFGDGYAYYTAALVMPQDGVGLPLFNADGEVLGLMQQPSGDADSLCFAVSALYADSLKISGLSINDATLRATSIKKALPADLSQAQLALFVAPSALDSADYVQLVDDFIAQFPAEQDGYVTRAQLAAIGGRYADADRDIAYAVKIGAKPDEVHFSYSRMIYQQQVYNAQNASPDWTLDRALDEAQTAYNLNPQPSYLQQQAYVLYAQHKYAEASALYEQLYGSVLRSPDLFVEGAQCRLMQADTLGQLALLDSAVALFSRPLLREAAPYVMARANARREAGRYRDAVNDLNDYEQLLPTRVNDSFYFVRYQTEVKGRLFQQALADIAKAIQMNPHEVLYYAEKASLEVRVNLIDDAIATATACIAEDSVYSEGYLFLGLAQCLKGDKAEGIRNLQKAKELGDEQADALIEKYGN